MPRMTKKDEALISQLAGLIERLDEESSAYREISLYLFVNQGTAKACDIAQEFGDEAYDHLRVLNGNRFVEVDGDDCTLTGLGTGYAQVSLIQDVFGRFRAR